MLRRTLFLFICFAFFLGLLSGCTADMPATDEILSTDTSTYPTEINTPDSSHPEDTSAPETTAFSSEELTDKPVTQNSPKNTTEPTKAVPSQEETQSTRRIEQTSSPKTEPEKETTSPKPLQNVHISSISLNLKSYSSKNEATPYLKGQPIYQLLYRGERVQIGDTLGYSVKVNPINNNGLVSIDASDNLKCTFSGDTLTVTVLNSGFYEMGTIRIYGMSPDGRGFDADCTVSFVIDEGGNPFDNLSRILGDYIRIKGMQHTGVHDGYTSKNPSLSITHYKDAPAWDDEILKSEGNYINRCLWLIDEYSKHGFKKVNFILAETGAGFSASY